MFQNVEYTSEELEEKTDYLSSEEEMDDSGNDLGMKKNFDRLGQLLNLDTFCDSLNSQGKIANASVADIVHMILTFSLVCRLPQYGVSYLFNMINRIFGEKIFPDTKYLVDVLFNPRNNITFHVICSTCNMYVGTLKDNQISVWCNECKKSMEVCESDGANFFVTIDPTERIENLLEENSTYYKYVMNERNVERGVYKDVYDGRIYREFRKTLEPKTRKSFASLIFNTDGAPVFKSSKFSIWPIQLMINELPIDVRLESLIVYGLWFGKSKPDMNTFMKPFVNEMKILSEKGVDCNIGNDEMNVKIFPICCCADAPARCLLQGLHQFNGSYGCNWCLHPGKYVKSCRAMKYMNQSENPEYRTKEGALEDVKQCVNQNLNHFHGFKSASVLLLLSSFFNIIDGFSVDYMHCVLAGIVQQFCTYWFEERGEEYSISTHDIREIDRLMKTWKVPNQIQRLTRNLTERKFWKCREYENFLLYYSFPILRYFGKSRKYAQHWWKVVNALHILLQSTITIQELDNADKLLFQFVNEAQSLYGKKAMTYNLHLLLHLARHVKNWGPLWCNNAFCFESGNGQILKTIHANNGLYNQICRYFGFERSVRRIQNLKHLTTAEGFMSDIKKYYTKKSLKITNFRYTGKATRITDLEFLQTNNLTPNSTVSYLRMIFQGGIFSSCKKISKKSDNSNVLLTDGRYATILEFIVDTFNRKELCVVQEILVQQVKACRSSKMNSIIGVREEKEVIDTNTIKKPCIRIKAGTRSYIFHTPNMLHY